jgi:Putative Ig domain
VFGLAGLFSKYYFSTLKKAQAMRSTAKSNFTALEFVNSITTIVLLLLFCVFLTFYSMVGSANFVDFEGVADATVLDTQAGARFQNATVMTAGVTLNEVNFPPHSGANAVFDDGGFLTILFDLPQRLFSGYFTYLVPLTIAAYDAGTNAVTSAVSRFASNVASGDENLPPSSNEFIEVLFSGGFSRLTIAGDGGGGSFVGDDFQWLPRDVAAPGTENLLLLGLGLIMLAAQLRVNTRQLSVLRIVGFAFSVACVFVVGTNNVNAQVTEHLSTDPDASLISADRRSLVNGEATVITVKIRLPDSKLVGGSVNVRRLDAKNKAAPTVLTSMNDEGRNGDRNAGDGVFSTQVNLNAVRGEPIVLQASWALKNQIKRAISNVIVIPVVEPDFHLDFAQPLTADDVIKYVAAHNIAPKEILFSENGISAGYVLTAGQSTANAIALMLQEHKKFLISAISTNKTILQTETDPLMIASLTQQNTKFEKLLADVEQSKVKFSRLRVSGASTTQVLREVKATSAPAQGIAPAAVSAPVTVPDRATWAPVRGISIVDQTQTYQQFCFGDTSGFSEYFKSYEHETHITPKDFIVPDLVLPPQYWSSSLPSSYPDWPIFDDTTVFDNETTTALPTVGSANAPSIQPNTCYYTWIGLEPGARPSTTIRIKGQLGHSKVPPLVNGLSVFSDDFTENLIMHRAPQSPVRWPNLKITNTPPLRSTFVGLPYSVQLNVVGGQPPYIWKIVSDDGLPPGIKLNENSGLIDGMATSPGTFSFLVQVQDAGLRFHQSRLAIVVGAVEKPGLEQVGCAPIVVAVGEAVSCSPTLSGGTADTFKWGAPLGSPTSGANRNFSTQFSAPGSKPISLDVCNRGGCAKGSMFVSVVPAPAAPKIDIVSCTPSTVLTGQLTACVAIVRANNLTWEWRASGGTPGSATGSGNFSTRFSGRGTYTLLAKACNPYGCDQKTTTVSVIRPAPIVNDLGCHPKSVNVGQTLSCRPVVTGSVDSWDWSASGGNPWFGSSATFSTSFSFSGTGAVSLRACNDGGCSSKTDFITVISPLPPSTPFMFSPMVFGFTVNLGWTDVSGETRYEVDWARSSSGPFSPLTSTSTNVTTTNDFPFSAGWYYYRVKACNASGCSSPSNVVSAFVL